MTSLDHPRSRGVYPFNLPVKTLIEGSSPLARGLLMAKLLPPPGAGSSPLARGLRQKETKIRTGGRIIPARAGFTLSGRLVVPGLRGIIPARAGFTARSAPAPGPAQDHPRSRGVYSMLTSSASYHLGSSPLARGLRWDLRHIQRGGGIIPARAGFTRPGPLPGGLPGDHPRSRGVYALSIAMRMRVKGSSPLARGLLLPVRESLLDRTDHPRSRGVYPVRVRLPIVVLGSSPLARGLPRTSWTCRCSCGIIPARAGFTPGYDGNVDLNRDHPRSRGVYPVRTASRAMRVGSSPLARGLPFLRASPATRARIIPARAGFTASGGTKRAPQRDHPRSRGVYVLMASRTVSA